MFLRTGLMIQAARMSTLSSRCLLMTFVMVICMVLHIELQPYEATDRQVLYYFDILGMISIMITIVVGMVCQYELDADLSDSWNFSDGVKNGCLLLVTLLNLFTVFYGLAALTFNTISLKLQSIMCANSDLSVDWNSRNFDWLVRKTFRGMNPVGYFTRNGRRFIDVSQLDEGERRFLVLSLTQTMSACFDSGSKIHTWLLENAIHEAFDRAMQARNALVANCYEQHGGRPFALVNFFGLIKVFKVNVRPPDIPTSSAADDALPGTGDVKNKTNGAKKDENAYTGNNPSTLRLFKKSTAVKGKNSRDAAASNMREDEQSSGVTVEELHNALSSVNVDVLERHPNIHRQMLPMQVVEQKQTEKEGKPDHYALTWDHGASLSVFEDYAKSWGSLSIQKNHPERYVMPDKDMCASMEKERDEYKGTSAHALKERELEESYAMMQEEIRSLHCMLAEAEAGGGGVPMLSDGLHHSRTDQRLTQQTDRALLDIFSPRSRSQNDDLVAAASSTQPSSAQYGQTAPAIRLDYSQTAPATQPESEGLTDDQMALLGAPTKKQTKL